MGHTTSASIGGAGTEHPKGPDASGSRCRRPGEGMPEIISALGAFIILRIVCHNLLRLLEPAHRDAVAHHVHRDARLDASVLISVI